MTNRLKLVGHEQSAFLTGKSSFDNIIIVQEIVHSLESDTGNPPRMFLKIDMAKAYDMVEWEVVLATLHLMNFPAIWIKWIRAYISCYFPAICNSPPGRFLAVGALDKETLFPLTFFCLFLKTYL